jgi:hypothetical protein
LLLGLGGGSRGRSKARPTSVEQTRLRRAMGRRIVRTSDANATTIPGAFPKRVGKLVKHNPLEKPE